MIFSGSGTDIRGLGAPLAPFVPTPGKGLASAPTQNTPSTSQLGLGATVGDSYNTLFPPSETPASEGSALERGLEQALLPNGGPETYEYQVAKLPKGWDNPEIGQYLDMQLSNMPGSFVQGNQIYTRPGFDYGRDHYLYNDVRQNQWTPVTLGFEDVPLGARGTYSNEFNPDPLKPKYINERWSGSLPDDEFSAKYLSSGGGDTFLAKYLSEGGAVEGPGTSTSDSIPALLSDGEFVIPADVVEGIGDGSTEKGYMKLYKTIEDIRRARNGRR